MPHTTATLDETLSEYTVSENDASEIPLDSGELAESIDPEVLNSKGKRVPPTAVPFDLSGYTGYQRKPLNDKRDYLKQQWLDVAYMVLWRAKLFARSASKKDYGKLVQLLMSAGIAYDKVFPKVESPNTTNLVLNLFNGLPVDKVTRVIGQVELPSDNTGAHLPLPPHN